HILTAFTAGTIRIHLQFAGWDDDIRGRLFDFSNGVHAGETGVTALVGVKWRNAHKTMHTALGFAKPISVLPCDHERGAFYPGSVTGQGVTKIHLPTAGFSPTLVHPQQHVGPVARLSAASAGIDAHDAIAFVVRAVKEDLQFQGF